MNRKFQLILVVGLAAFFAMGFSPYALHLRSGRETHVGLIAEVTKGEEFAAAVRGLVGAKGALADAGISRVQAFTRKIEGKDYAVIYFSHDGRKKYLDAAEVFEKATASSGWSNVVKAHPRAVTYGRTWLQMEWINFIRGVEDDRATKEVVMIGTKIIPEKEMEYRTLHQTVWPAVVDGVVRSNSRNLSVFMLELGDHLVEFLYVEYVGSDKAKDDAQLQADPTSQRWWKLTDACQTPFSDVKEGIWAPLDPVK